MNFCAICDGPVSEGAPTCSQVRGFRLTSRGKVVLVEPTGEVAHWNCVELASKDEVFLKQGRLSDWGLCPEEE